MRSPARGPLPLWPRLHMLHLPLQLPYALAGTASESYSEGARSCLDVRFCLQKSGVSVEISVQVGSVRPKIQMTFKLSRFLTIERSIWKGRFASGAASSEGGGPQRDLLIRGDLDCEACHSPLVEPLGFDPVFFLDLDPPDIERRREKEELSQLQESRDKCVQSRDGLRRHSTLDSHHGKDLPTA